MKPVVRICLLCAFSLLFREVTASNHTKKEELPNIVGEWKFAIEHAHLSELFNDVSYEKYCHKGISFAKAPPVSSKPLHRGWPKGGVTSDFVLSDDGNFRATETIKRILPNDGVETMTTTWSGLWQVTGNTLFLTWQCMEQKGRWLGKHENKDIKNIDETFRFRYISKDDSLTLFLLFDKDGAFRRMLKEIDRLTLDTTINDLYGLYSIPDIISNSYSCLTLYTIERIREIIEKAAPESRTQDLSFIREIVIQWYEGQSELPEVLPEEVEILGKWYINGDGSALYEHLTGFPRQGNKIHLVKYLLPQNMEIHHDQRLELELNIDKTYVIRDIHLYAFGNSNRVPCSKIFENRGKWELNEDTLNLSGELFRIINDEYPDKEKPKIEEMPFIFEARVKLRIENDTLVAIYLTPEWLIPSEKQKKQIP